MLAEIGLFLLIIAMAVAGLMSAYLVPVLRNRLAPFMPAGAWLQCFTVTFALLTLMVLRLDNDFSVMNVISHSNASLPPLYKITGSWGNHEGSILLWVWVLAAYGLAYASLHRDGDWLTGAVQSLICTGFVAFILFTSNPFERQFPPAADGQALNPLLQDIALAMHPPLLYLGYVGFSMVFSFAVAALIRGGLEKDWAEKLHPWILFSWASLTAGIGLGSWWAYRELGWGGWWYWDPVENASLLPWLAGTALLHANSVLKKRGLLAQWVVVLAIVTFALSLLGTFLVRSGVLTSVHGFASDPARGMFILGYMVLLIGGALLLFGLRGGNIVSQEKALPLSREGIIVINNLLVMSACAVVLLGTIYPILIEWIDDSRLTVGPDFYNATFLPIMAFALLFTAIAPFLPWKKAVWRDVLPRLYPALLAVLVAVFLVFAFVKTQVVFAALGFGLAAWLGTSSIGWFVRSRGVAGRAALALGHLGAAVLVFGITGASLWKEETERPLAIGDTLSLAGYDIVYEKKEEIRKGNHTATIGEFSLNRDKMLFTTLHPEFRRYDIQKTSTSEASIYSSLWADLYVVIGESEEGHTAVRFYYIPLISFIWLGFVLIAAGGMAGIMERKRHE